MEQQSTGEGGRCAVGIRPSSGKQARWEAWPSQRTSQHAGRGTTRRRGPSPIEVEGGYVHRSQRRTRTRRNTCVTGGVALSRRRSSIGSRARRGQGGEVAPTENGRKSDGPSHSSLLLSGAVPSSQNAGRAAGSSTQTRSLSGSTPARTQQGYQALPCSDGVHSRVWSSPQMPSYTAPRSRDSSFVLRMPVVEREASFGGVFWGREHLRGGHRGARHPSPAAVLVGEQAILPPCHRVRHWALGTPVTGIRMPDVQ